MERQVQCFRKTVQLELERLKQCALEYENHIWNWLYDNCEIVSSVKDLMDGKSKNNSSVINMQRKLNCKVASLEKKYKSPRIRMIYILGSESAGFHYVGISCGLGNRIMEWFSGEPSYRNQSAADKLKCILQRHSLREDLSLFAISERKFAKLLEEYGLDLNCEDYPLKDRSQKYETEMISLICNNVLSSRKPVNVLQTSSTTVLADFFAQNCDENGFQAPNKKTRKKK
jgi:hypothetical protein